MDPFTRGAACVAAFVGFGTRALGLVLAPVLLWQGKQVRRTTPRLAEAAGRFGACEVPGGQAAWRLLVLGESTAAGVGVSDHRDGLAGRLAEEMAYRSGRPVQWEVSARSGATASVALRTLLPDDAELYDVVLVALGVNDTLRLQGRKRWRRDMTQLVSSLMRTDLASTCVLLAGVPDLGAFPALPRPLRTLLGWHARALDGELHRLAASWRGVLHAPAPILTGAVFADDGFHPNADAYARWARHLADLLHPALSGAHASGSAIPAGHSPDVVPPPPPGRCRRPNDATEAP